MQEYGLFFVGLIIGAVLTRLASLAFRRRRVIRPSIGMNDDELRRSFGFGRTHPLVLAHRAKIHALRDDAILACSDPRARGQKADMLRGRIGALLDLEDEIEEELDNVGMIPPKKDAAA